MKTDPMLSTVPAAFAAAAEKFSSRPALVDEDGSTLTFAELDQLRLLAARALADHFDRVTILERDNFPAPGENRKGVPQGRHAHALLPAGRTALEGFFPGFTAELEQQGALTGDPTRIVIAAPGCARYRSVFSAGS